jgi:hypothetical protein
MFARVTTGLTIFKKYAKAKLLSWLGKSDYATWRGMENLDPEWDARSRLLAEWIPEGSSVIEFGAGRLAMKKFLPQGCKYTPSDLVDRGEGTIVLDLNARQLPGIGQFDVAIFGGVIEYIFDVDRLASFTAKTAKTVVFSYVSGGYLSNPHERTVRGWVNNFAADELVHIFEAAGFRCAQRSFWNHSLLCSMSRVD